MDAVKIRTAAQELRAALYILHQAVAAKAQNPDLDISDEIGVAEFTLSSTGPEGSGHLRADVRDRFMAGLQ